MTIDNLIAARVVGADGVLRRASSDGEPGSVLGDPRRRRQLRCRHRVRRSRCTPIPKQILAGLLVFPIERTPRDPAALPRLRRPCARVSERLGGAAQGAAAAVPAGRGAWRRTSWSMLGAVRRRRSPRAGASHVDQLRAFGPPLGEHVGPVPYGAWQQAFDPLLAAGARNYWKSHNFTALSDGAIETLAGLCRAAAVGPQRDLRGPGVGRRQPGPDLGDRLRRPRRPAGGERPRPLAGRIRRRRAASSWARAFYAAASAPFASGGAYVNFMTGDEAARVPAAYGENYARLVGAEAAVRPRQRVPHQPQHRPVSADADRVGWGRHPILVALVNLEGGPLVILRRTPFPGGRRR